MTEPTIKLIEGGLGVITGLQTAGVKAGFRKNPERLDLALVLAPKNSTVAAVFTKNSFSAAPVDVSKEHLASLKQSGKSARAIVLNSGNANATTGEPGRLTALNSAKLTAELIGCDPEQVLLASTGVIGAQLNIDRFLVGLPLALDALSDGSGKDSEAGLPAAQAIMTTDTVPKQAASEFTICTDGSTKKTYRVAGMCKGSGMIQPNMATMLAVLATDATVDGQLLDSALRQAVGRSFNKVTVDSDTSTNDSVFLLATGSDPSSAILPDNLNQFDGLNQQIFVEALSMVCENLARQIARDGEGATKLVTVNVTGAKSAVDADLAARSIANSPLVKTAIAGHDANWGRIAMALGKSGADFVPDDVDIKMMGIVVCKAGIPVQFSEEEAKLRFMELDEISIDVNLGAGSEKTTIWSCDFTHEYISINADYRT